MTYAATSASTYSHRLDGFGIGSPSSAHTFKMHLNRFRNQATNLFDGVGHCHATR